MEDDNSVVEKDIGEDSKTSMAVAEDQLENGLGAQTDAHMLIHEVSDAEFRQLPKDEDNSQDPCIEKLELKDQEHKLASSINTDANKSEDSTEEPEKRSALSELKTTQKSDAKSVTLPSKKYGTNSLKAAAILKKKPSKEASASASNGRSLHSLKGSMDANMGPSSKINGGASGKAEAAKLSEAQPSTSGLLLKQALRKSHSNFTVPQPFALATDKRASLGGQPRVYIHSRSFNSQIIREGEKKANDGKGDDPKCQESAVKLEESKAQLRAGANTFNFNSDVRAERRKEFNSRVEERLTAKEAEKTQAQAKTKEDIQAEIKQFRKSLTFKATPMPSFYHDAPPKPEIKKIPPTRAKSPKLGRRNSTAGAHGGHSHTNHNAKENNGQNKVVKTSSQAADPKKLSKKALKQVSGPNASSEKAAFGVLDNEMSSNIDKSSVCGTESEKEGLKSEGELLSEKCNGGEPGVHHDVAEEAALNEGQHDFSGDAIQV